MSGPSQPPLMPPREQGAPPAPSRWQRARLGLSRWWNGGVWQKIAVIAVVPFLCICACCSGALVFAATPYGQQLARQANATSTAQAIAQAQAAATATQYAFLHPRSTATPRPTTTPLTTPTPLATKTPTPRPVPTATTPPPPPTATPVPQDCQVICNPWGYDFTPGNLIYSPDPSFCTIFPCIPSFWNQTNGYVEECQDGDYSHSGGRSGSCSYHGGNLRPLYSH